MMLAKPIDMYKSTDAVTRRAGRAWYIRLNRWLYDMTQQHIYPFENVVCAFSALSPRIRFRHNCLALVELFRDGDTNLGYGQNVAKAKRLLLSDHPLRDLAMKRPSKCDSYARAILGDVSAVTLDTWMLSLLGFEGWITTNRYRAMADVIKRAAIEVHENPRDMQAILWIAERGKAT